MTKNNAPQLKEENTNLDNSKNIQNVIQKPHSSEEHQTQFIALQNELRNAQNEVTNLKIAQYKFTSRYFKEILCFYENLHHDITKFLELEHDSKKNYHFTNALN